MAVDPGMRDPHRDALSLLLDYDQQHNTALLATLEQFLLRRGSISATSEALYIHPNTLRQRLRRIAEVTGIDLARDDWLVIELALKLLQAPARPRRRCAHPAGAGNVESPPRNAGRPPLRSGTARKRSDHRVRHRRPVQQVERG